MTARIGAALTAALASAGMTRTALAEHLGVSPDGVCKTAAGIRIPTLEMAERMAEALDAPEITIAVVAARTKACRVCNADFVDRDRAAKSHACSPRCQTTDYQRRRRGVRAVTQQGSVRLLRNRLTLHQDAVRAFCSACTGRTMLCEMPKCELRSISPARLARRAAA